MLFALDSVVPPEWVVWRDEDGEVAEEPGHCGDAGCAEGSDPPHLLDALVAMVMYTGNNALTALEFATDPAAAAKAAAPIRLALQAVASSAQGWWHREDRALLL